MEERLQKILAQAGFGSRRSCEELIVAHRVKVNGKIAELGSKADGERDTITVDGQGIPKTPAQLYIALNKPREILSDIDPNDPRKTVHDLVNIQGHLFAVGRLDYESEGLILMTNDGELANRLTHPRYGHEKEYHVLVGNRPDDEQLATWRRGVVLADGYKTQPAEVNVDSIAGKGAWLRVVLREGRKRQIREVGSRIGLPVLRIMRVRIGTLLLGDLKVGEWRYLTADEVRKLKTGAGNPSRRPFTPRPRSSIPYMDHRPLAKQNSAEDRPVYDSNARSNDGEGRRSPHSNSGPTRREDRPAFRSNARPNTGEHRSAYRSNARPTRGEDRPSDPSNARPTSAEDRPAWRTNAAPKAGETRPAWRRAAKPMADEGQTGSKPVRKPHGSSNSSGERPVSREQSTGRSRGPDQRPGDRPKSSGDRSGPKPFVRRKVSRTPRH